MPTTTLDAYDETSATILINDYTDDRFNRFEKLIWRGMPTEHEFGDDMDGFAAFRTDRSQECILRAADVLCDANYLTPIQSALAFAVRSFVVFRNVEPDSLYLQTTALASGIEESTIEIYVDCFMARAFDIIGWLLTLNEIKVSDYSNTAIYRLCRDLSSMNTTKEEKRAATDTLNDFTDFLSNSIRWKPVRTKMRTTPPALLGAERDQLLKSSIRLTCAQVAELCRVGKSTAQEWHAKGVAGWKDPQQPDSLYWFRSYLTANAKQNLEDFLKKIAPR